MFLELFWKLISLVLELGQLIHEFDKEERDIVDGFGFDVLVDIGGRLRRAEEGVGIEEREVAQIKLFVVVGVLHL